MHGLRPTLFAVALGAGIAGCLIAPPLGVGMRYGTVQARSAEEARTVASLTEEMVPRILELVPGLDASPLSVWVVDAETIRRLPGPRAAVAKSDPEERRIFLASRETRPIEPQGSLGRTAHTGQAADLAHELVHVLLGPEWRTLPDRLEEGLADWVSCEIVADGARGLRLNRLLAAHNLNGTDLEVSLNVRTAPAAGSVAVVRTLVAGISAAFEDDLDQRTYASGFVIASHAIERIGTGGLLDLCRKADAEGLEVVPDGWVSEAAGFPIDDPEAIRRAAANGLTDGDVLWLARQAFGDGLVEARDGISVTVGVSGRSEVEVTSAPE